MRFEVLSGVDVDVGFVENPEGELFDELMDVAGFDVVGCFAGVKTDQSLPWLVLVLDVLHDVFPDEAGLGDVVFLLGAFFVAVEAEFFAVVLAEHDAFGAMELGFAAFALLFDLSGDGDELLFEFELDEIFVVQDFFQIFFRIIIELNLITKYHCEEFLEEDSPVALVVLREKLEKETDFLSFAGFEYFG